MVASLGGAKAIGGPLVEQSFRDVLAEVSSALVEQYDRDIANAIQHLQVENLRLLEELQDTGTNRSHKVPTAMQSEDAASDKGDAMGLQPAVDNTVVGPQPLRGLGHAFAGMAPPPPDPAYKPRTSPTPPASLPGVVHIYPEEDVLRAEGARIQQSLGLDSKPMEDVGQASVPVSLAGSQAGSSTMMRPRKQGSDSNRSSFIGQSLGVLGDPDRMKALVREAISTPHKSVSSLFLPDDHMFSRIARSSLFENLTMSVIFVNAIWISVDIDYNKADLIINADPVFQVMENLFCFYFTGELVIRFCSYRKTVLAFKDPPFLFDFALVFLMVIETWVMTVILLLTANGGEGASGIGQLSIFRVARLGKMFRMARMARILRSMPELVILVKGIGVAARSVCFTLFLLMIIIYVFAVGFRQVTAGTDIGELYFRTVPRSMNSLLLRGTLPDNAEMVYNMAEQDWWLWPLIMLFILLASLTVMNMLVGVLVEVVGAVAATERENMVTGHAERALLTVMDRLDGDGDMRVSQKEIEGLLVNPDACRLIKELGVDAVGLVDMSNFMFADKPPDATLAFEDFLDMVMHMRGSNPATVKDCIGIQRSLKQDLMKAMHQQTREMQEMRRSLLSLKQGFQKQQHQNRHRDRDKEHLQARAYESS
mmetsp:Transcript_30134/g.70291  ORF Transcript_30134/g.70291 Transcript_30134/m.70291 type:complete len:652 (-) Transcript_30134:145-2100(-)|eukprot:CAMPEP_0178408836 /NCGR_PEP_ID=MMETSP0689_2-20121128/20148_1 /TAXON_ID=160604 /ORGANISM="Amphidinium massartii, Strain CS-259" /LENGTH=651 /DNA_ID=CAMNT_0020029951 /DNA_START=24 /DNA_END=1982 /DNA_ORIENTATION=-